MRIVTMVQTKGGSGKTTLGMVLASAALSKGQKVVMFDGDVNEQLLGWHGAFKRADWGHIKKPSWPVTLHIAKAIADATELYAQLDRLEADGTDLVIIDTRPGTYTDTEDLALAADVVLIPARPAQAEWRLALSAFEWMRQLHDAIAEDDRFPEVRAVLTNVPAKIISAAAKVAGAGLPKHDMAVLKSLLAAPHFDTMIPASRIFEHFLHHGPLPTAAKAYRDATGGALMANNLDDLLAMCVSLYDEILEV